MNLIDLVIACIVVFSGYFVLGLTGFGGGLIVVTLLLFFMDIKHVVPAQTLINLALFSASVFRARRHVQWAFVYPVFIGSFFAVLFGTYALTTFESMLLRRFFGVLVTAISLRTLIPRGRARSLRPNRALGLITGVVSGLLSALFGAGGPVAVIYFSHGLRGKERMRATLLFYFLLLQTWVMTTYVYSGLISREVLRFSAIILPSSILGMLLGSRVQASIGEATFQKAVAVTLFITGVILIIS